MALIQSKYATGVLGYPYPAYAGAVVSKRFTYAFAAAPSLNDIVELAPLPNGVRVIDMILDSDDMDSGTSMQLSVGIMSGAWGDNDAARTCGAEFISASTIAQTGGVARPTLATAFRTAPAGTDRSIGVKIAAAAGTFVAGQIGLTVLYATD